MSLSLQNLYCTPNDLYEQMGIEATQLRLDDKNIATGQQIIVTTAAAIGDTTLVIQPLQYPLLTGSHLVFELGGIATPVEVTVTVAAPIGALSLTVAALGSAIPVGGTANDNGTNVWLAGLMAKACQIGTGKVKDYCCCRYNDDDLYNNSTEKGAAFRWACAVAVRWLSKRLFQSAPEGSQQDYEEAMEELKMVQNSVLNIADIGTRTSGWPFMSNVTIDDRYTYRKVRVEPVISEGTPTQFAQSVDYNSIFNFEW